MGLEQPNMLQKNLGVRIPDDAICQAILQKMDAPLISTSVNWLKDNEWMIDPVVIADIYGQEVIGNASEVMVLHSIEGRMCKLVLRCIPSSQSFLEIRKLKAGEVQEDPVLSLG